MASEIHHTDVAIIGAGPVGLFAVFELGMLGIDCHVVDALDAPGGQCAALYPEKPIYDIPGYPEIMAHDLVGKLLQQIKPFAPVYHLGQQVTALAAADGGDWRLTTSSGTRIEAGAVILAAGVGAFGPNRPPLDGIGAFERQPPGTGVHYFVTRREHFRDRRVVIAGGGDSAVDWALALAETAASVALVHRRDRFRAAPESVRRLRALADSGRIEMVVPFQLHGLDGEAGRLTGVIVSDLDGHQKRLAADALLPFFGLHQDLGPIADWGLNLHRNHIVVEPSTCAAGPSGIFAIGDVAEYPGKLKLILTGFSEAAMAAHAIFALVRPGEALHFEYSTTKGVPGGEKVPTVP
jgi:thioredoxin reductase (NADPH)